MHLIEELYLGWHDFSHADGCTNPVWDDVQVRYDEGRRFTATGTEPHTCTNVDCGHATGFGRMQVRLRCSDCNTVHILSGEGLGVVCTTTEDTGWGQAPTQVAGVWLWPGEPVLRGLPPRDYLVTTTQVDEVTTDTIAGLITTYRDSEGRQLWIAGAGLNPNGAHQVHTLRWTYSSNGLASLEDAARWVATADQQTQRPAVVAV